MSTGVVEDIGRLRAHAVHFYATEQELAGRVASFLGDALDTGGKAVAIATAAHRDALRGALRARGIDPDTAVESGDLVLLDAADALAGLMVDGRPDARRFEATIAAMLRRDVSLGRPVAAFGEMVQLLWEGGDVHATMVLEGMWNELLEALPISLLCAYRSDLVGFEDRDRLCSLHTSSPCPPSPAPATRDFDGSPDSPRLARAFVAGVLAGWGETRLSGDAALVVSELATNAVLHARSAFSVAVEATPTSVRLSVRDRSAAPPAPRETVHELASGRGLALVSALADAWGVETAPEGKVVWALMRRDGGAWTTDRAITAP